MPPVGDTAIREGVSIRAVGYPLLKTTLSSSYDFVGKELGFMDCWFFLIGVIVLTVVIKRFKHKK